MSWRKYTELDDSSRSIGNQEHLLDPTAPIHIRCYVVTPVTAENRQDVELARVFVVRDKRPSGQAEQWRVERRRRYEEHGRDSVPPASPARRSARSWAPIPFVVHAAAASGHRLRPGLNIVRELSEKRPATGHEAAT
jgi:hypothetical protein